MLTADKGFRRVSELNFAHSTTKCDSDENCLTKSDDTQDLGQNARGLSRDIAVDEKLNPQTSAWAFSDKEELQKLQKQGLVDKLNGGAEATHQSEKHPNWKLGQTSKHYESGNRGVETISSSVGDNGGKSYGLYL